MVKQNENDKNGLRDKYMWRQYSFLILQVQNRKIRFLKILLDYGGLKKRWEQKPELRRKQKIKEEFNNLE